MIRNFSLGVIVAWCALGAVADEAHFAPCVVRGKTEPKAYVVANSGEITQADEKGHYALTLPVAGTYCLKAMKDGHDEASRPWLVVPTKCPVNLPMWALPNPARRVVHGNLGHPAQLVITDDGAPVRGFDLAGTRVGSYPAPKGVWHSPNKYFWTLGEYAFTATGEVKIVESLDFPALRQRGWYKGDFHAHIVHGENFYRANVQQMNFICRAERYDWIYLAQVHGNDEYPVDAVQLCRYLSDPKFMLRVNCEFPKNELGHFGTVGVGPFSPRDYGANYSTREVSNLELAEKTVYAHGGLCVPVHPLDRCQTRVDPVNGRTMYPMLNNELALWLLCCPERMPVVDFFYNPEARAEKFWYHLLNKGYTLGCSGSSDAAFDVGRSPSSTHATYAKLDALTDADVVKAFRAGRTMVSYFGAGVVFEIDGHTSGDVLPPSATERRLVVDAYANPGRRFVVRVIRNGEVFDTRAFTAPADGHFTFSRSLVEKDTAWYVVTLKEEKDDVFRSAASPIYFRGADFKAPAVLPLPRPLPPEIRDRIRYLTPAEALTDAWFEELRALLERNQRR